MRGRCGIGTIPRWFRTHRRPEMDLSPANIGWGHQIRNYVLWPYQLVKGGRNAWAGISAPYRQPATTPGQRSRRGRLRLSRGACPVCKW